jgi:hypothetical protein
MGVLVADYAPKRVRQGTEKELYPLPFGYATSLWHAAAAVQPMPQKNAFSLFPSAIPTCPNYCLLPMQLDDRRLPCSADLPFPFRLGRGLLVWGSGLLQTHLACALTGLNFWMVNRESIAFKRLCLSGTKRLGLMVRSW